MQRKTYSRRNFALSLSRAAAIGAGFSALFTWAYRRQRRAEVASVFSSAALEKRFKKPSGGSYPSLAVVRDKGFFDTVKGKPNAEAIEAALRKAFEALGGIERFMQPGDSVLIKPNAGFATHPSTGAVVNPELVAALIRYLRASGAKKVFVTDNPIATAQLVFERTGLKQAVEASGGELIFPRKAFFRRVIVPNAEVLPPWPVLITPFFKVQVVIGVACVKDHNLCGASLTLKNWYGLLGGVRSRFHQRIDETICDLWRMVLPARPIVILDGLRALIRNGPTGGSPKDVVLKNTIALGTDPVATDSFGATLLGKDPASLTYLNRAERAGFGTTKYKEVWKEI